MADGDWIMQPENIGEWVAETLKQRGAKGDGITLPAFLYRYFAPGGYTAANLTDVLVHSRMRLNAKSEFNDPFDSHCDWLPPESREEIHAHFYHIAIRHGHKDGEAKQLADNATKDDEYWKGFYDSVRGSIEKTGIVCFAESPLNFLMWSHYASQHKGAVLEFHTLSTDGPIFSFFPVRYGDNFPRYRYSRKHFDQQVFRSLLYKSTAWRYEMEWRIVEAPHAKAYGRFDSRLVKSVTFGCKAEDNFKQEVLTILAERKKAGLPDVELFQTKLSDKAFELERVPLA